MPREWLVQFEGGSSEQSPHPGRNAEVLSHRLTRMRGDRDRLEADPYRDELQQFEEVIPHTRSILTRGSDQSPSVGNSGESPAGSFNAVRRRELFFGDEEDRVDDNTRGRAETKPAAKSSTMNGTSSPCRSEHGETRRNANWFTPKGRGAACRVVPQKSRIDDSRKLRRAGKFGRTAKPRGPQNL